MNYSLLLYPIVSLMLFYGVFILPGIILFVLFLSPTFMLRYLEDNRRTSLTDRFSLVMIVVTGIIEPIQTIWYIIIILIPIALLYIFRKRDVTQAYISPVFAPLPFTIIIASMIIFSAEWRGLFTDNMLSIIDIITAPVTSSPNLFNNYDSIKLLMKRKDEVANYMMMFMPAISYVAISIGIFIADRFTPVIDKAKNTPIVRDYRLPDNFVIPLLVCGFCILIPIEGVKFFSYNALIIFTLIYFYQGFQLLSILFDRIKMSFIIRGLMYMLLFSEPMLFVTVALFGLSSVWFRLQWTMREDANG